MRSIQLVSALLVPGALVACGGANAEQNPDTLYGRVGGFCRIAAISEDFVGRVLRDGVLNENAKIREARDQGQEAGVRVMATLYLCDKAGGPYSYPGPSLAAVQEKLGLTEAQWRSLMGEFKKSLQRFNVAEKDQRELIAIAESVHGEVIAKR